MKSLTHHNYCHYCLRSSRDPLTAVLCLDHVVSHLFKSVEYFFPSHENVVNAVKVIYVNYKHQLIKTWDEYEGLTLVSQS